MASGDGFDLEQDVGHGTAGDPDDGLGGRGIAATTPFGLADYVELVEVDVHHVRPTLDDMAEVESNLGVKGDALLRNVCCICSAKSGETTAPTVFDPY